MMKDPRLRWTVVGATAVEHNTVAAFSKLYLYEVRQTEGGSGAPTPQGASF